MERRKYSREFKLEALNLVRERGVAIVQAARDLDFNHNMFRRWFKEHNADPKQVFLGLGIMKPEQLEIDRLRREVARLNSPYPF
jgi:transposase